MKKAIIYCRVSSKKQVQEGHGLTSQETNCRKYAREHGLEVVRVFQDDYTGGGDFWNRPGLTEMLGFLEKEKEEHAVIFDDLKRFARDTLFHLKLRQELNSRNAYPRCPNFRFEDTPEGEFVETIIAATGELERKQNKRQVVSRMKARLEAGHWVFPAPLGYKYERRRGEKRVVMDSPTCEHVREALEGYASGTLTTQLDVAEFLKVRECYSKWSEGRTFSTKAIRAFLSNEFYAGWCVCKAWNIRVRGQYQPLITEETYRQIIQRIGPEARTFIRKDAREDFPLRGHIYCGRCRMKLTACWSQGRSAKYPYYRCLTKGCIGSVRAPDMEELFLERLQDATPTSSLLRLFESKIRAVFGDRERLRAEKFKNDERRISEINREIDALVDSVARASTPSIRRIFENKITALQGEKERLEDQRGIVPHFTIEPIVEQGHEFLKDPCGCWQNGNLQRRNVVQELTFQPPIIYDPNSAYQTAEFSLVYRMFETSRSSESSLVDLLDKSLHPVAEEMRRWVKIFKRYSV